MEVVYEDKYLKIELVAMKTKTKVYNVIGTCTDDFLGTIEWYPQWRHYCFFPDSITVYSDRCLEALSEFLTKINKAHYDALKETKKLRKLLKARG